MTLKQTYIDINQDLIVACRNDDREAQVRIYKLYYKAMYNTSLRIVNNTAEAEDIIQDSFLEAFRKIDSFKGQSSFGAWLKKIVINNSLDFVKQKKHITSLDEEKFDVENISDNEDNYSENIFCRLEEIRDAFDKLPENYRIILSLFLLEGYDHQEISQILKIPYNNTRTRYSRAKQKLLQIIMKSRN